MYGVAAVQDARGVPQVDGALEYVNAVEEARTSLALQFGGGVESSELGARIVAQARSAVGTPYIWAGGTPSGPSAPNGGTKGFDCSGLVMWAVYNASDGKIALPHLAKSQGGLGQAVLTARGNQADLSLMSPGDVIAFKLSNRVGMAPTDYDHVGIYIGGGRMIHAPKPGSYVSEADLSSSYWATTMWTVRRMG
nr:C40 family peptidase [Sanguibacter hominis]